MFLYYLQHYILIVGGPMSSAFPIYSQVVAVEYHLSGLQSNSFVFVFFATLQRNFIEVLFSAGSSTSLAALDTACPQKKVKAKAVHGSTFRLLFSLFII